MLDKVFKQQNFGIDQKASQAELDQSASLPSSFRAEKEELAQAIECRDQKNPEAETVSASLRAGESVERVAIAQITTDPGRLESNLENIVNAIKQAREAKADLVVFPELTIPGYHHMDLAYDPDFIRRNKQVLERVKEHSSDIAVIVGFIDEDESKQAPGQRPYLHNSAAVIQDGQLIATQDKLLLPNYRIFTEQRYFNPGREKHPIQLGATKLGVGICEDFWKDNYDRDVASDLAKQGADILVSLNASPFHQGRFDERAKLFSELAREQQLPFIYANLVGSFDGYDSEVVYDGRSMLFNKQGELQALGDAFQESLMLVDLSRARPFALPETDSLAELHDAIMLGIKDYFRRQGFKKAYIGLSGGIDSAVVAALVTEAIGPENVTGVTMPSHITSAETKGAAHELASNLGIAIIESPLSAQYQATHDLLKNAHARDLDSLTKQNIQARLRGLNLMGASNLDRHSIVVSTGNKTEVALGYCTLYGDMAGGFSPISDVNKLKVYALARYINQQACKTLIPTATIEMPPTAELEEDQTDEANLPAAYDILAPLVDQLVEAETPLETLYQRYGQAVVDQTRALIQNNEYKRRQAAPGIRVTPRAFGMERRIPMDRFSNLNL